MTEQVNPTVIVKLVNGHEVVGEVVSMTDDVTTLKQPMMIQYRINGAGYPSIALLRYSFFGENSDVWFPNHHIITCIQPRDTFVKYYQYIVDQTVESMNQSIDKELSDAVNYATPNITKEAFYNHLLENMSTEIVN